MTSLIDYLGLMSTQPPTPAAGDMVCRSLSGGWTTFNPGSANQILTTDPGTGLPTWTTWGAPVFQATGSFGGYRGAAQSMSSGDVLACDSEAFDVSSWLDTVTTKGRFTPQSPGIYRLSSGLWVSTALPNGGSFYVALRKNGVLARRGNPYTQQTQTWYHLVQLLQATLLSGSSSNTYFVQTNNTLGTSLALTGALQPVYINAAHFPAGTKLNLSYTLSVGNAAQTTTFQAALYQITGITAGTFLEAGGSGAIVASEVPIVNPAANSINYGSSGLFDIPSSGLYVLGIGVSPNATVANTVHSFSLKAVLSNAPSGANQGSNVTGLLSANGTTDYFDAVLVHNNATPLAIIPGGDTAYFQGEMVGHT